MGKKVTIVVLHTRGCPSTPKTLDLLARCLSETGIRADLRAVLVGTQEEADEWRFLGSPTVQVNGRDIDPGARGSRVFGFM